MPGRRAARLSKTPGEYKLIGEISLQDLVEYLREFPLEDHDIGDDFN